MVNDNERMVNDSVVKKQQESTWPFPTQSPPKPWTDEQIKEYNDKLNEEAPL